MEDAETKREEGFYKSCLKDVVKFLNATLPPIPDEMETDNLFQIENKHKTKTGKNKTADRQILNDNGNTGNENKSKNVNRRVCISKIHDPKKKTKMLIKEAGLIRVPAPKKIKPDVPKKIKEPVKQEETVKKRKRINKYSALVYEEMKNKRRKKDSGDDNNSRHGNSNNGNSNRHNGNSNRHNDNSNRHNDKSNRPNGKSNRPNGKNNRQSNKYHR